MALRHPRLCLLGHLLLLVLLLVLLGAREQLVELVWPLQLQRPAARHWGRQLQQQQRERHLTLETGLLPPQVWPLPVPAALKTLSSQQRVQQRTLALLLPVLLHLLLLLLMAQLLAAWALPLVPQQPAMHWGPAHWMAVQPPLAWWASVGWLRPGGCCQGDAAAAARRNPATACWPQ